MSIVPTNLAASMAAAGHAERAEPKEKERKERVRAGAKPASGRDPDLVVVETESADAVRAAAGNGDEETHEDRESRSWYNPGGAVLPEAGRPRIDLEG